MISTNATNQCYSRNSKWSSFPASRFIVSVISAENYVAQGDMIRDLDGKAYIREDFLLIEAGVITNTDLGQLMEVSPAVEVIEMLRKPPTLWNR